MNVLHLKRFNLALIVMLLPGPAHAVEPAFRIAEGLFDATQPKTLGLKTIRGETTLLYKATKDTYRFCHHPNLIVFGDRLYCMWSNGKIGEDEPGQRILYAGSDDGLKWSKPVELAVDPRSRGACVASGFIQHDGRLIAFFTVTGGTNFHPGTALWAKTSRDATSWSDPQRITSGFFIEAPDRLPNGHLLLFGEFVDPHRTTKRARILVTREPDGLSGWTEAKLHVPDVRTFGYTEPSPWLRTDGTIVTPLRNYSGFLYSSISQDRGVTWSTPVKTSFPDSTARSSTGRLPDGSIFLINNPGPGRGNRALLTIALSRDGVLFDRAFVIHNKSTKKQFDGRHKADGWQYPNAIVHGKHLFVAYSINKEDVGLKRIALSDLQATRK